MFVKGTLFRPCFSSLPSNPLQKMLDLAIHRGIFSPLPLTSAKLRASLCADDVAMFINLIISELHAIRGILQVFGDITNLITIEKLHISEQMRKHRLIDCAPTFPWGLQHPFPIPLPRSIASHTIITKKFTCNPL